MTDAIRISIGFHGGQVLALRVAEDQLKALHKALGGTGWHELDAEDGPVRVDLGKVVYVSSERQEPRVGFGQSPRRQVLRQLMRIDERLLLLARTRGHTPAAERAVARFSALGEHAAVWLALGALGAALDAERRPAWRRATERIARVYALNTVIKLLVRRRRPSLPGLPALTGTATGLSFPSAHASTSFAGARSYARLGLPRAPLGALAGSLALSRLYLGVHYPSDVLAGALLGSLAAGSGREAP